MLLNIGLIKNNPNINESAFNLISRASNIPSYKEYVNWLNSLISELNVEDGVDIISRITSQSENSFYGAVAELVFGAFWKHLKWPFNKAPSIGNRTPDFRVIFDSDKKQQFICEISVVTHNQPHHNIERDCETGQITVDGISVDKLPTLQGPIKQTHRFAVKLCEKFRKYIKLLNCTPFVMGLYVHGINNHYLSDFQLYNALFGKKTISFPSGQQFFRPSLSKSRYAQNEYDGVFAFEEFKGLSAVIICRENWHESTSQDVVDLELPINFKAKYSFGVYVNPLGCWPKLSENPFHYAKFPVSGLIDSENIKFNEPALIAFY